MKPNALRRRASVVLAGAVLAAVALATSAGATPSPAPPSTTPPDTRPPGLRAIESNEATGSTRITTSSPDPTEHVDPLIGTSNLGDVFPGAVTPFGMFSFSPETSRGNAYRTAAPGGYLYDATKIRGFSLTHMSGTGCAGGSGDIPIFPYAGEVTSSPQADAKDDAGDHNEADYDGGGVSYSRQALAAAGLTSGGTATKDGLTFTWPGVPAGDPDNVPADGQLLNVSLPAGAGTLSFVGSAVNGNQEGKATLTYSDGSTDEVDLSFSDWTLGGGGDTVHFGNLVMATTPYRNEAGGGRDAVATHIFATAPFTFPAGKTPVSVTLPKNRDLRIFTLATG